MPNQDGTITLKDIITEEGLRFGEKYEEQAKKAIAANDLLIKSSKQLSDVVGMYRTAGNNSQIIDIKAKEKSAIDSITEALREQSVAMKSLNDERDRAISLEKAQDAIIKARNKGYTATKKAIDDERVAHTKNVNSIKEEQQATVANERAKQETIKTEKEISDLAKKTIQENQEKIKLLGQEQSLEQKMLATEKEEAKLLQELERLEQQRLNTNKAGLVALREEERLKKDRLATIKEEKGLIEQEQRLIKNGLDIKNKELSLQRQEEAAKKRNTVLTAEEKVQNELLNKAQKQQARENLGLVGAYEKLNRQRTEAQKNLANLLSAEVRNNVEIQKSQREYDTLNRKVKEVDNAVDIFSKNIGNYQGAFDGLGGALTSLVAAFGVGAGISTFVDVLQKAFDIIREYEAEVVNLAAVAGKTRDEIKPLEETIQAVAAASVNSATDVAKLASELIKLGSTPEEAEKLLKPVNDLSVALRATAEDAAGLVKGLLNGYGEGAQEAARYTDVLAEAANRSALDFNGLRDSFGYIAPTARTLNFSLEKTAALLGILVDNNIKAESAGRLLSTGLGKIANSGLTLEDALDKINKKQNEGADSLEILTTANGLFGVEAGKLAIILSNNREKIIEMTAAYENSKGSLEELTDKQLKSLDAQLKILDSSFEDYVLKTNESTGASRALTDVVKFLGENLALILNTLTSAILLYGTYRLALLASAIATRALTVSTNAMGIASAFASKGIAGARAEIQALNVATKINPFGLIVTGIIAAGFAIKNFIDAQREAKAAIRPLTDEIIKNYGAQRQNIDSTEELAKRYEFLRSKSKLTTAEQKELNEILNVLQKTVPEAADKFDKYGKVLDVNLGKIKEYVKNQKEIQALKVAQQLEDETGKLVEQKYALTELNKATQDGNFYNNQMTDYRVKSAKIIFTENGVLRTNTGYLAERRDLTRQEIIQFKELQNSTLQNIEITKQRIATLKNLESQANATNVATGTPTGTGKKEETARTIELIDEEIKAEKDKIDQLTYLTRDEGKLIDKRIAALQKEREAIYSTQKAQKDAKKIRDEYLANLKKTDDDAYNLAVFRLNRIKSQNDQIIENVDESYQKQIDAEVRNQQLLLAINEETAEKRLRDISRYNDKIRDLTDDEINTLMNGGQIKKKLNSDEILALEQYFADRDRIYQNGEANLDKLLINRFEKNLNTKTSDLNNSLNTDLIRENERFANEKIAFGKREQAVENHEKKIAELKRLYAIKALQDQISIMETLLSTEQINADKRREIEAEISNKKREISDLTTNTVIANINKEELSEKEKGERLKEMAGELKDALVNLANAIFEGRISKIDDEISKNDEYYRRQIELAGDDQRKKDLLEKESEKKRDVLEKKKREEQRKQAIFNKALKIADIIGATALARMQAFAQLGPILGAVGAAIVTATGALELAAVLATPIPKYKGGRKGGKKEIAWVGDGFVNEVIEDKKGNVRITPNRPTLTQLEEGDSVYSSKDAYMRQMNKNVLNSIYRQHEKAKDVLLFVSGKEKDTEIEDKLEKAIEKGFNKAKINNIVNLPKQDIPHSIWASNNIKWN